MIHRIHHFGDFRLDPAARTLYRGNDALTLPARAFDCIVYLIERRERAVGRDELIAGVWGKPDVSDGVLGQTILVARRTLDDTGREQTVIRTVLRFGYHWVAAVETIEASSVDPAAVATVLPHATPTVTSVLDAGVTPAPAQARRSLPMRRALGTALLLVLCGFGAWFAFGGHGVRHRVSTTPALALVLPIAVNGEDDRSAWMRLGVMDLVATRLRSAGQAVVPSDNVVALVHGRDSASLNDAAIERIAAAAGAGLVIDARAWHSGTHWRVVLATRRGLQPPREVSAKSADVLEAARGATDALAAALGLAMPRDRDPQGSETALDTLLQKIKAALLVDHVDVAHTLIEQADPALRAQSEVRFQQGHVEFKSGRLNAAQATFQALLDATPGLDGALIHGRIWNAFGAIAIERHDPAGALPSLDKAVDLLGGAHTPGALGTALNNRAAAHGMLRDYDAALADFAQARIMLQAAGDQLGLAVSDSNLATLDMNRDRYAEAAPVLERASKRFAGFHARDAELNARSNEVLVRVALLEPAKALAVEPRLLELIAKVADPARRATAELTRVHLLFANGRLAEARSVLATLRADAARAADDVLLARVQAIAARDLLDSGQTAAAAAEADAARVHLKAAQDPVELADNWLTLLRARIIMGQVDAADADLAVISAWAAADGATGARLRLLVARAELEAARDHADAAGTAYQQALVLADAERVPADILVVCRSYVAWLIANRDPARASIVAERVAGWAAQDYDAALLQVRLYHGLGRLSAWQSALARARALAGERVIPAPWVASP